MKYLLLLLRAAPLGIPLFLPVEHPPGVGQFRRWVMYVVLILSYYLLGALLYKSEDSEPKKRLQKIKSIGLILFGAIVFLQTLATLTVLAREISSLGLAIVASSLFVTGLSWGAKTFLRREGALSKGLEWTALFLLGISSELLFELSSFQFQHGLRPEGLLAVSCFSAVIATPVWVLSRFSKVKESSLTPLWTRLYAICFHSVFVALSSLVYYRFLPGKYLLACLSLIPLFLTWSGKEKKALVYLTVEESRLVYFRSTVLFYILLGLV